MVFIGLIASIKHIPTLKAVHFKRIKMGESG